MLSVGARTLLKIPTQTNLPASLDSLYDQWFAGRSYETRFGGGWSFRSRGGGNIPHYEEGRSAGYDICLEHRTAQFWFGLDSCFRVHVKCENWVRIASSFVSLVERDVLLVASPGRGERHRGFGCFPSFEGFLSRHSDYLAGFQEVLSPDPAFTRFFRGSESMVIASRFYSDEYEICGIEYF